jgi:hypothetical protein
LSLPGQGIPAYRVKQTELDCVPLKTAKNQRHCKLFAFPFNNDMFPLCNVPALHFENPLVAWLKAASGERRDRLKAELQA